MSKKTSRSRKRFDIDAVVRLADVAIDDGEDDGKEDLALVLKRAPKTFTRKFRQSQKRRRPKGRKNVQPGAVGLMLALARDRAVLRDCRHH